MRFRSRQREEPEINLIPFIDVLLVVVIFLMLTTTYSKFSELQIKLPTADAQAQRDYPKEVVVAVSSDGRYLVNGAAVAGRSVEEVALALTEAAKAGKETVVIIHADANAVHQSVVTVMEAASRSGLSQITFAAQTSGSSGAR
ncbi:MAG: biopolymer transporter ExbD [Rhodoferax sp.]|uniref:ExbD/TolR family protein n=1 Tax=Rhodoferax sp. TaxID=50421 RepID=UPI0026175A69|nr:biopolymer transporter ExbD [Rhodoferax sp.]MDD5336091.1 biopolymer transporter ExbD [Rhodoferax sp.]